MLFCFGVFFGVAVFMWGWGGCLFFFIADYLFFLKILFAEKKQSATGRAGEKRKRKKHGRAGVGGIWIACVLKKICKTFFGSGEVGTIGRLRDVYRTFIGHIGHLSAIYPPYPPYIRHAIFFRIRSRFLFFVALLALFWRYIIDRNYLLQYLSDIYRTYRTFIGHF